MRSLFTRLRNGKGTPLESELRASRSQPPKRLVNSVVAMVRPQPAPRPARLRLAFAGGLTVVLVAVAGATGGLSYAATAVSHVANAVHITASTPKAAPSAAPHAVCSQYALPPTVSGINPTLGQWGSQVTISGNNFQAPSTVTAVRFRNDKFAIFSIDSNTQITATVPTGAKSGNIVVTNCAGSALTPSFTVVQKPPCVTPNVVGDKLSVAKQQINAAHCSVRKITYQPAHKPANTYWYVTWQKPQPGRTYVHGYGMDLKVSPS